MKMTYIYGKYIVYSISYDYPSTQISSIVLILVQKELVSMICENFDVRFVIFGTKMKIVRKQISLDLNTFLHTIFCMA